jgi:hypothetical protein
LVRVDLQYDELIWEETTPALAFGEVWYRTTVSYAATFELEPDLTLIVVPGARAEFKVRQAGDEWQLVEWRDLGGYVATTSRHEVSAEEKTWGIVKSPYDGALVQAGGSSTWGGIKALYRE